MFKVGDRIKCIDPVSYTLEKDRIYTVKQITSGSLVILKEKPSAGGFYQHRFILTNEGFSIGTKVKCINSFGCCFLRKNSVYTIERMLPGKQVIWLEEVSGIQYGADRFEVYSEDTLDKKVTFNDIDYQESFKLCDDDSHGFVKINNDEAVQFCMSTGIVSVVYMNDDARVVPVSAKVNFLR